MPKLEISRVHDAYEQDGECPLCLLMDGAERTYLVSFQHGRVMEPNVRVQTNALGFCPDHLAKLAPGENKLGLALVMLTHLEEQAPKMRSALNGAAQASHAGRRGAERIREIAAALEAARDSCFICGLLAQDIERYAWTILYLWRKDPGFPAVFRASRGFCIGHFSVVLRAAADALRADRLQAWLEDVVPAMERSLDGLAGDLLAFTQLHQAGNSSLGTEAERTALARVLRKLGGGGLRGTSSPSGLP